MGLTFRKISINKRHAFLWGFLFSRIVVKFLISETLLTFAFQCGRLVEYLQCFSFAIKP